MSEQVQDHALPGVLPWQRDLLRQALSMPGHAVLIHGTPHLGQYELALALAMARLCESPERARDEAACGVCPSCKQIQAKGHTDLVVLMPETVMLELGWPISEKAQKQIDDKARKPSQEIRIEATRDALAFSELTSGRGRAKVILVYPAQALNAVSANALLKTLEEPAQGLHFVLASEALHRLLPTLRSRCQALPLKLPAHEQALAWLKESFPQADAAQCQMALRASGGRPFDAARMIGSGLVNIWPTLPRALQQGRVHALADLSIAQVLNTQFKLCHDLWRVKLGVAPRFFDAADLPPAPPARALEAWGGQIRASLRVVDHPLKADLFLEDLVQQAKVCINSRV